MLYSKGEVGVVKGNTKTGGHHLAETDEREEYLIANRKVRPCILRIHRLKTSLSSTGVSNARLQQLGMETCNRTATYMDN